MSCATWSRRSSLPRKARASARSVSLIAGGEASSSVFSFSAVFSASTRSARSAASTAAASTESTRLARFANSTRLLEA